MGGLSARQAAARFGVGVSTAIAWVRRARAGERTARRQGQPKGSKLDAHADYLRELIAGTPNISLRELQTRLAEEKGVSAGVGTLWRFFAARAITFKKRMARPVASGSLKTTTGRSASTYPASGSSPPPRWRSARPGPHKTGGIGCRFLNQADKAPVDRQAIFVSPPTNLNQAEGGSATLGSNTGYISEANRPCSKQVPCRSVAQAIRASLLARATIATLL